MQLGVIFQFWSNRSGVPPNFDSRCPTQLSRVAFYGADGEEIVPVQVHQEPAGGNPSKEKPAQLLVPSLETKWLTRIQDPFLLYFTFPEGVIPYQLAEYEFFTANDFSLRDPTCWEVFIQYNNEVKKFGSQRHVDPTTTRLTSMGKFPFELITAYELRFAIKPQGCADMRIQFYDREKKQITPSKVESVSDEIPVHDAEVLLPTQQNEEYFYFYFEDIVSFYQVNGTGRPSWTVRWQDHIGMWTGLATERRMGTILPLRGGSRDDKPSEIEASQPLNESEMRWKEKLVEVYSQIEEDVGSDALDVIRDRAICSLPTKAISLGDFYLLEKNPIPEVIRDQLKGRIYYLEEKNQHLRQVKIQIGSLQIWNSQPSNGVRETLSISCMDIALTKANARYCQAEPFFEAMRLIGLYDTTLGQFLSFLEALLLSEIPQRCSTSLEHHNPFAMRQVLSWPGQHKKSATSG